MQSSVDKSIEKICAFWEQSFRCGPKQFPDKDKVIQDAVHGAIEIEKELVFLLDSIMMQRLRKISQLGLANQIFPSANHTRLEHSLGVMHLVGRILERIRRVTGMTSDQVMEAKAAALLHDIGHLPFSHVSESLLRADSEVNRELEPLSARISPSELISMKIIKSSWMKNILRTLNHNTRRSLKSDNIANMAVGLPPKTDSKLKFLGELIHGNFDVDRMDYLLRDAHCTGVPLGTIDLDRLIRTTRTKKHPTGETFLVIDVKGLHALESMIAARWMMYSAVYYHHAVRAVNSMLSRAIFHAFQRKPLELLKYDDESLFVALCNHNSPKVRTLAKMLRSRSILKSALTLKAKDALNKSALMNFVKETNLSSFVSHEDKISHSIFRDRHTHVILDLPKLETYSEIKADVMDGNVVAPVRDHSDMAKGIEQDYENKWRGYVFGTPEKLDLIRKESLKYLRKLDLEFKH